MNEAHLFAIGLALAALAGVRVYLTVFGIGLAGLLGWVELPQALQATSSYWVLGTAGTLALVEFFADKIPGVDSGWDLLHTLLRIPVGAFLAAATLSPDGGLGLGALAAGAGVASFTHILKSSSRALINLSPEPASNWTASLGEDAVVLAGLSLAFAHPWLSLSLVLGLGMVVFGTLFWLARRLSARLRRRT
jgi:Domain of unknown function (DUF4126)